MSAPEMPLTSTSIFRRALRLIRRLFQVRMLFHVFRIAVSLVLLPLDSTILSVAVTAGYLYSFSTRSGSVNRRREILQDARFYPKTILVTGLDTPHGLRVARCWYREGHRVVGADVTDIQIASGESVSKALVGYYRISKTRYVSTLLDIIQREKVDMWIPCSQGASVTDDAMAKQAIESRTDCKCITFDSETAIKWSQSESFLRYLTEKDLPIVESHQVQSRDAIHKILHRSPTKIYHMRRTTPTVNESRIIVLPKRTLSLTYSEVSEIQVTKDSPWLLLQHARIGEFLAELLLVRGYVSAITIHPANGRSDWGRSPLNDGLATAIRKVMDRFAFKTGTQVTGHLSIRVLVDEELESNSVRYVIHIAGSTLGAAATTQLLQHTASHSLVSGYLAMLSAENGPVLTLHSDTRATICTPHSQRPTLYGMVRSYDVRKVLPALYPVAQRIDYMVDKAAKLLFWKNWRFSLTDPLPWWWHAHIYRPLRELDLMVHSKKRD